MALQLQLEAVLVELSRMNIQLKRPEVHPLFGNNGHTAPYALAYRLPRGMSVTAVTLAVYVFSARMP